MGNNMEKEIISSLEKEGFRAHYYPGCKMTNKAIIAVGGASCDEKTCIAMSGFLRKEGYNVLVLGFYLWKGLSKNLASIPIDYVEKAVKWIKEEQGIEKIAMTGASTGAGYTLVCASRIPEITCVIPVEPFGYDLIEPNLNPDSRIRVEDMNADVLLLAAKNDDCWPSDVATKRMIEVFKEKNYSHRVESHIYEKGSHALVDGMSEMSGFTRFLFKLMIPAEKKYPKECEEARQDSFKRIVRFIEEW